MGEDMSELEKMRAGEWYDANFDPGLAAMRLAAKRAAHAFNQAEPGSPEQAAALERVLGAAPAPGVEILAPLYVDYGGDYLSIGEGTFVNHGCYLMDGGTITLGKHVFVGPYCGFYTASHPLAWRERNQGLEKALPIRVGDDCWLGAGAMVMPGVTIGRGCVIAAGSVVTHDVPDNSLVTGVPGRVMRTIDQG